MNKFNKIYDLIFEELDTEEYLEYMDEVGQIIFSLLWADWLKEIGQSNKLSGQDITEIAPEYQEHMTLSEKSDFEDRIYKMFEEFENANKDKGDDINELWKYALMVDGQTEEEHDSQSDQVTFGYYIIMEMLGHGVAWTDDHENPNFKIPHNDISFLEFPDSFPERGEDEDEEEINDEDEEEINDEGEEWKAGNYSNPDWWKE